MKKKLPIPVSIDDYNHHMNAVDVANQIRASYTSHMRCCRNWLPIFWFFLDAANVNTYQMQQIYNEQHSLPGMTHKDFTERIYHKLFSFAARATGGLPEEQLDKTLNHN